MSYEALGVPFLVREELDQLLQSHSEYLIRIMLVDRLLDRYR